MSLITDPYKTFKDQALRIWETKDFAERLAFSRTGWFNALLYSFMVVIIIHFFILIAVVDLLILADFYGGAWYIDLFLEVINATVFLQLGLFFFWTCDRSTRLALSLWKAYSNKEKDLFLWTETKIKLRYPKYKTTAQRVREQANKPRKPNKLQKWIRRKPPIQRRLIRIGIWTTYGIFMFFMIGTILYPHLITWILTGEIPVKEVPPEPSLEQQLENQPIPKQPDGRPPSTIYDIFIRQSDSVVP